MHVPPLKHGILFVTLAIVEVTLLSFDGAEFMWFECLISKHWSFFVAELIYSRNDVKYSLKYNF